MISALFHLNHVPDPLCSLCHNYNETPIHFFCECSVTIDLWNEVIAFFRPAIVFNPLTPESALFGIFADNDNLYVIKNLILLLFKYCVYKNRDKTLNKYVIINFFKSTYEKEKVLNSQREEKSFRKWSKVAHLLQ